MAIEDINSHHMILPDYELILTVNDTQVSKLTLLFPVFLRGYYTPNLNLAYFERNLQITNISVKMICILMQIIHVK